MSVQGWAGAAGVAVAICAVCGHVPGQQSSPPQDNATSFSSASFTDPNPDPGADQAARDALKAITTPAPGEDELVDAIHAKYGPSEQQPGESGASWCHRQRLMEQMAGGDISEMGCQVDGVNYPDPVLSPNAATDWH
jgi:hypothetical protein